MSVSFSSIGGWLVRMLAFILLGVVTAAVGEIQFSVFIRSDFQNFLGSVVFNSFYLFGVALISSLFVRLLGDRRLTVFCHLVLFGASGLMIEWFMIGNSPWAKPEASQVGMFAYWSCMALVPFICLHPDPCFKSLKRTIGAIALVYIALALMAQGNFNAEFLFIYHIWSVIIGYSLLAFVCVAGYARTVSRCPKKG